MKQNTACRLVATLLLVFALLRGPAQAQALRVGMELSYPPFEMKDKSGEASGVGADMARALAKKLGRPLVVSDISFSGLIPALKTGKIDLIISSMTATEERRKAIAFSTPYVKTGLALLVSKKSGIQSLADLDKPGRKVAVRLTTTGEQFAKKHLKNAKVVVLEQENACATEVDQGKVDAFIYDQIAVLNYQRKFPDTTKALLEPVQVEAWAIGLALDNKELLAQVNQALADLRKEGLFKELAEKHLADALKAFKEAGVSFIFDAE